MAGGCGLKFVARERTNPKAGTDLNSGGCTCPTQLVSTSPSVRAPLLIGPPFDLHQCRGSRKRDVGRDTSPRDVETDTDGELQLGSSVGTHLRVLGPGPPGKPEIRRMESANWESRSPGGNPESQKRVEMILRRFQEVPRVIGEFGPPSDVVGSQR